MHLGLAAGACIVPEHTPAHHTAWPVLVLAIPFEREEHHFPAIPESCDQVTPPVLLLLRAAEQKGNRHKHQGQQDASAELAQSTRQPC